jgi:predicted MFS family arabinose efflux permease
MLRAMADRGQPTPDGNDRSAAIGGGISPGLVGLLAVACGATVANLYYAQPLLHTLGRAFHASNTAAGLLFTISQIGFVLGLAFLVPLGDLCERRSLISRTMLLTGAALAVTALAPSVAVFAAAIAVVGFTSVMAQVIVPMSASLSHEHERGRVIGTVMSGLLIGILTARTVSGLLTAAVGWRFVFWFAAAVMLVMALTLRRALPRVAPTTAVPYRTLLRSILTLIASEPVLRQRMMLAALTFGCFSTLWTPLSFLLSAGHFHYGNAAIGLFGLAGVAGAGAASVAGRLADRGHLGRTTTATILIMLVSWAPLAAGKTSVVALIAGIVVLDLGAQGLHISNQNAIYALAPEARSRLATAYMVAYFIGGAAFSAISSAVYDSNGWDGVCVLGAGIALAALVVWAVTEAGRVRTAAGRAHPASEQS